MMDTYMLHLNAVGFFRFTERVGFGYTLVES